MRGIAVRLLQAKLRRLGYPVVVDGVFGPRTEAAVRGFQRSHGLEVDGVVGPATAAAINRAYLSSLKPTAPRPGPLVFLDVGHYGKASSPGDRGASYRGVTEAGFYIDCVGFIRDELKRRGCRVVVFPDDYHGRLLDYPARNDLASKLGAALYVQLHLNAGRGNYGVMEYVAAEAQAKRIADAWQRATGIETKTNRLDAGDRGHICIASVPKTGIVFESFFIDNDDHFNRFVHDPQTTGRLMGAAIAAGVGR